MAPPVLLKAESGKGLWERVSAVLTRPPASDAPVGHHVPDARNGPGQFFSGKTGHSSHHNGLSNRYDCDRERKTQVTSQHTLKFSWEGKEKKMSSTQLFRVSGISLLLGALINLIAALLVFFVNTSFTASPATFQSPLWSTYYSLSFASIALTLIGLPAFYLRMRSQRGDRLGFFGLLFIVFGTFLILGMAGYFVSVLPLVAAKAPQILKATLVSSGFGIFPLGGTLLLTIGTILLGIAVLRAKVFPVLVGILLLVWTVLNLANFFLQSGLPATLVGLLSAIAWAGAYGWVGLVFVQQSGTTAAAYQPQTVLR